MRHGWKLLAAVLAGLALASAADAQTKLRYKFKEGERLEYAAEMDQKMAMNVLGNDVDIKTTMNIDMTWQTLKVDEKGNAKAKVTVNRAKMTMEGGPFGKVELDSKDTEEPDNPIGQMLGGMVKAMGTMEMTFTVDPTGEVTDVKVAETTLKKFKKMPAIGGLGNDMIGPDSFKSIVKGSIIMPLPKEEIDKGKTWTEKAEQSSGIGRVQTETKYTYDGEIEKGGKKLAKIGVKPDVKIKPADDAKVQVKLKSNSSKGTVLFDNQAGRIAEARNESTMQMEMEAAGMTIDANMTQNMTIRMKGPAKSEEKKTTTETK
jgi:hypothetical protein